MVVLGGCIKGLRMTFCWFCFFFVGPVVFAEGRSGPAPKTSQRSQPVLGKHGVHTPRARKRINAYDATENKHGGIQVSLLCPSLCGESPGPATGSPFAIRPASAGRADKSGPGMKAGEPDSGLIPEASRGREALTYMDCRRTEGGRFKCKWALIDDNVGSEPKARQKPHVGPRRPESQL